VSFLIISGCTKDQDYPNDSNSNNRTNLINPGSYDNVYGSWIVTYYKNLENDSIINKSDVDSWGGLDVEIKFMPDSTFCGKNTSNIIGGLYLVHDSIFDIKVYGGTKMGQPKWGYMFSDVVYSHSFTYFLRCYNELILYYNNNKNCIVLHPSRKEIHCRFTYSNDWGN